MVDAKKTVVLVADDEPSTRALVANHMQNRGFEVIEAADGDEAWTLAHEHLPDLVILDVMMPGMGGFAVLRQLKNAEATKGIPVIVLTSLAQRTTQLEATTSGADLFFNKPFTKAQLLTALRQFLPEPG